jgi:hypothetical protein
MSVHRDAFRSTREDFHEFRKIGAGAEIFQPLARLHQPRLAGEMALLADRIAPATGQLCGIHQPGVIRRVAMAAGALYAGRDLAVAIQRSRQNVLFLPLYSFGNTTGPPAVKPHSFWMRSALAAGKKPRASKC